MNYNEAVTYMEQLAARGSILGLERIDRICELLGNPQDTLRYIHVAGTNGKGSTSCMIASILGSASYSVGMYYSPAMTDITDHYTVNGIKISGQEYAECVNELRDANIKLINEIGEGVTQFEAETVIGFLFFKKKGCDVVVLETGLGGRDDATNIVSNKIACVFTSISYDHVGVLGNSLKDIANVKAGIITEACPVVFIDSGDEVNNEITKQCKIRENKYELVKKSDIKVLDSVNGVFSYKGRDNLQISLLGEFQLENAAVAVTLSDVLRDSGYIISEDSLREGLKNAYWPYRLECICDNPKIYVDGAHNSDAAEKLARAINSLWEDTNVYMIIGMFKDKDYKAVIGQLAKTAYKVYTVTVPNKERALSASVISELSRESCKDVMCCESIYEAAYGAITDCNCDIKSSDKKTVVIACGSLSYLDEFKKCAIKIAEDRLYNECNK